MPPQISLFLFLDRRNRVRMENSEMETEFALPPFGQVATVVRPAKPFAEFWNANRCPPGEGPEAREALNPGRQNIVGKEIPCRRERVHICVAIRRHQWLPISQVSAFVEVDFRKINSALESPAPSVCRHSVTFPAAGQASRARAQGQVSVGPNIGTQRPGCRVRRSIVDSV